MSEASEETRVGIKAAFPVKKRELNGLNRVAAYLNDNRAERVPVVGYVEFVKHTDTISGDELTVALVVVEPVVNAQGRSVKGYADDVRRMIEDMRRSAGKPSVAETLFDAGTTKDLDDEIDGQIELPVGGAPEKDAAELAAERAEGVPADQQTVTDKPEPETAAAITPTPGRKARGATVRPTSDPFTPTDAA
jgi:hypothetical protein